MPRDRARSDALNRKSAAVAHFSSCANAIILHMRYVLEMPTLRASYTIDPEVLLKFNELVPPGERSKIVQVLMRRALVERTGQLEALADEFETHPDFAQ